MHILPQSAPNCTDLHLYFQKKISRVTLLDTHNWGGANLFLTPFSLTLGVVGVVGVFVAKIVGHFAGPKGAKIHRDAPICYSSQLRAMAVLSSQKVSATKNVEILRYSAKHI